MRVRQLAFIILVLGAVSCNGTTGDQLVTFPAHAQGATAASEPFSVNGYTVQLTFAQMYIGAVYINEAPLSSSASSSNCANPGVYAAEVPGGVEVNLLSAEPQPFSVQGNGTADLGQSWELWLTEGNVNNPDNTSFNTSNIVDLQGTATRELDGAVFTFAATVNINQSNRGVPVSDPSQPGLNPICKQRIIEAGGIHMQLFAGGALTVTVDPRGWFNLLIDFSSLPSVASSNCEIDQNSIYGDAQYCIPDTNFATGLGAIQGRNLFTGILTGGPSAYQLSFTKSP